MKEMLIAVVILIVGFVLLIKGADFFVDGSSSVAKRLRVPSMIIGLTIVSMGTSLPECAVSVTASLHNDNCLPDIPMSTHPERKTCWNNKTHNIPAQTDSKTILHPKLLPVLPL